MFNTPLGATAPFCSVPTKTVGRGVSPRSIGAPTQHNGRCTGADVADDHPTAAPDEDEYGKVPTPDEPYTPGGEDEPPPDERND
jgi:hypothetical protein